MYKIIISIFFSFLLASINAQEYPNDYVFFYKFDGNAFDSGLNNKNGIIKGDVKPAKNRFNEENKALLFNGLKSGYIKIPYSSTQNIMNEGFTFSIWVKLINYHSTGYWPQVKSNLYAPIFCKAEFKENFQYRFCLTGSGFIFDGGKKSIKHGVYYTNGKIVKLNKWHLLTVTYEAFKLKMFVDGKFIYEEKLSKMFAPDNNPLVFGKDFPGATEYFDGYMDDFKIWRRALTNNEVGLLYNKEIIKIKAIDSTIKTIPEAFEIKKGDNIILKNILFASNSDNLLEFSKMELNKLLITFKKNPKMKILLKGHTDNSGDSIFNINLSKNRALSVKRFLVNNGVSDSQINTAGFGFNKPLVKNDSKENKALNRRVECEILSL